jgi:hypothetical protein
MTIFIERANQVFRSFQEKDPDEAVTHRHHWIRQRGANRAHEDSELLDCVLLRCQRCSTAFDSKGEEIRSSSLLGSDGFDSVGVTAIIIQIPEHEHPVLAVR